MRPRDRGQGPAVLLLHGTPAPAADWDPLDERLAGRFRVLVPELPGYGDTPALASPTMERVGDALHAMLEACGVRDLAAIVGFSSGAYRALDLALRHRPEVRAVISLGGMATFDEAGRAMRREVAGRLRADPGFLAGDEVRGMLREMMLSPSWRAAHPADEARILAWPQLTSPAALAGELEALASARDLRGELSGLRARVYARVGELDVAAPPAVSHELVAHAAHGRVEVVPGCGHTLLVEDREASCAAIVAEIEEATT